MPYQLIGPLRPRSTSTAPAKFEEKSHKTKMPWNVFTNHAIKDSIVGFGFLSVFISIYRSVECPPRPSDCPGSLRVQMFPQPPAHVMITWPSSLEKCANFEAGSLGAERKPRNAAKVWVCSCPVWQFSKKWSSTNFQLTYNYLCSTAYVFYICRVFCNLLGCHTTKPDRLEPR